MLTSISNIKADAFIGIGLNMIRVKYLRFANKSVVRNSAIFYNRHDFDEGKSV